jgi:hypothetical protein
MKKKLFKALTLCVLSTCVLSAQVPSKKLATITLSGEQAKLAALRTMFISKLAASKTFMNKLGSGMKNHVRILALVTLAIQALPGDEALKNCKRVVAALKELNKKPEMCGWRDRGLVIFMNIGLYILLTEVFHYVYKKTGSWLEQEPARCKELLTDIAVHWRDYKAETPVVLHPLFEKLADDTKVHGELTIINDSDACKLVESVLAMSAVVEAAA